MCLILLKVIVLGKYAAVTVKEKYNVCRVGSLMLTCCNITQLLPSDASGITLLVAVNLFDYVIMLCLNG